MYNFYNAPHSITVCYQHLKFSKLMGKKVKTHYYLICIHWVLILSLFHDYLQTFLFLSIVFAFFLLYYCYFQSIEAKYIRVIILCKSIILHFFLVCCLYCTSAYDGYPLSKKMSMLLSMSVLPFESKFYILLRRFLPHWHIKFWEFSPN